jgi:ABC-2 type transport system ATP-binding protein
MIAVNGLTKRFGDVIAVDDLSFEIEAGEIVGLLGPNGAGKTTTMRILSTFLPATFGTVTVDGLDVFRHSLEVRRKIGYLPEHMPLYNEMRVAEYLVYRGRLKGLGGKQLRTRLENVLLACGLGDERRAIIGRLSKGYRQRVGLADALIHEPRLLILDEPTIGLDPRQVRQIRALIRRLSSQHTILLSTHILSEVEMVCERVLILNKGRIVASDRTDDLVGLMRGDPRVVLETKGPSAEIAAGLASVAGVVRVRQEPGGDWCRFVCECQPGSDPRPELFKLVASNNWLLRELSSERRRLEDVFVEITSGSGSDAWDVKEMH